MLVHYMRENVLKTNHHRSLQSQFGNFEYRRAISRRETPHPGPSLEEGKPPHKWNVLSEHDQLPLCVMVHKFPPWTHQEAGIVNIHPVRESGGPHGVIGAEDEPDLVGSRKLRDRVVAIRFPADKPR